MWIDDGAAKMDKCGSSLCGKRIEKKDKEVVGCESVCKKWFHRKCTDLTKNEYDVISNRESLKWFCQECCGMSDGVDNLKDTLKNCTQEIGNVMKQVEIMKDGMNKVISEIEFGRINKGDGEINRSRSSVTSGVNINTEVRYSDVVQMKRKKDSELMVLIKPKVSEVGLGKIDTVKVLKEKIKPAELRIGITRVKTIRNGEVLVGCESKEELERLMDETKSKMGETHEVRKHIRKEMCKVMVIGVNKEEIKGNINEWEEELMNRNNLRKVRKVYTKDNYSGRTVNIIIEIKVEDRDKVLRHGVNIGWERCRVVESMWVKRCFKCSGYGHSGFQCRSELACSYCAGKHTFSECQTRKSECINCMKFNVNYGGNLNTKHDARDKMCPCYIRIVKSRQYQEDLGYEFKGARVEEATHEQDADRDVETEETSGEESRNEEEAIQNEDKVREETCVEERMGVESVKSATKGKRK